MLLGSSRYRAGVLVITLMTFCSTMHALSMEQLLNHRKMSPKRFANYFENFRFEKHIFDVQNPKQFLSRRAGDCIDYAVLADHVLTHHHYNTRLIRVEMMGKNIGHAVCYVDNDQVYLDYNNRKYFFTLTKSKPRIRQIATKVAKSLEANWTFAQEFTFSYEDYKKIAVQTVVKIEPPSHDPDA